MLNIHLTIKACKYEIMKDMYSLSARDKINSIMIYENDFIMDRILNDMDLWEIWRFLLKMFDLYHSEFKVIRASELYNWSIVNYIYFDSKPIPVSANNIAIALPKRVREKYFSMDIISQKYVVNSDLYLTNIRQNDSDWESL